MEFRPTCNKNQQSIWVIFKHGGWLYRNWTNNNQHINKTRCSVAFSGYVRQGRMKVRKEKLMALSANVRIDDIRRKKCYSLSLEEANNFLSHNTSSQWSKWSHFKRMCPIHRQHNVGYCGLFFSPEQQQVAIALLIPQTSEFFQISIADNHSPEGATVLLASQILFYVSLFFLPYVLRWISYHYICLTLDTGSYSQNLWTYSGGLHSFQ